MRQSFAFFVELTQNFVTRFFLGDGPIDCGQFFLDFGQCPLVLAQGFLLRADTRKKLLNRLPLRFGCSTCLCHFDM